jgi:uncharacterized protein YdhG (YjbR/CyaY superfamily)
MQRVATSVTDYLNQLPETQKTAVEKLYSLLKKKLPKGFTETMQYGMITFVVPHSIYPNGYHCKPTDALPFVSLAAQKNFIALYHMGIYAFAELQEWFVEEYSKHSTGKLDMGKSCIRFKKPAEIPYKLIEALATKITVKQWIEKYETMKK